MAAFGDRVTAPRRCAQGSIFGRWRNVGPAPDLRGPSRNGWLESLRLEGATGRRRGGGVASPAASWGGGGPDRLPTDARLAPGLMASKGLGWHSYEVFLPPPSDFGGFTTLGVPCFSTIAFTTFCCCQRSSETA
jgi:hypothetical protein